MTFITARRLQHEFQLPLPLAQEMITEQTQYVLRRQWQPWAWMICWLVPALTCWFGWQPWVLSLNNHAVGLALLVACGGWFVTAQWLAGSATLASAADKARQLNLLPQESAQP